MSDLQQRVGKEPTVVDVLRAARALIERGWTQFDFARDAAGDGVEWDDNSAVCWCCYGALREAEGQEEPGGAASELLRKAIGRRDISIWNDAPGRTQAEALAAFDRAIELAQSEVSNA